MKKLQNLKVIYMAEKSFLSMSFSGVISISRQRRHLSDYLPILGALAFVHRASTCTLHLHSTTPSRASHKYIFAMRASYIILHSIVQVCVFSFTTDVSTHRHHPYHVTLRGQSDDGMQEDDADVTTIDNELRFLGVGR